MVALLVAVAGALGSLARYLLSNLVQRAAGPRFPVGTLTVNVLGSFAIGVVMATFAARQALDSRTRIAITAGFLGGFTTYSAFAWDAWALVEARAWGRAIGYVAATIIVGIAACVGGVAVTRAILR
jgi:CrcB protein